MRKPRSNIRYSDLEPGDVIFYDEFVSDVTDDGMLLVIKFDPGSIKSRITVRWLNLLNGKICFDRDVRSDEKLPGWNIL